jgi:tetratricopeptide (TPR) repeat protein
MKIKSYLLLFFVSYSFSIFSQDMQEGYTYLETGEYLQAEKFFEKILEGHPQNRTARLCYARATGLSGKSEQAKMLFTNLLADYPSDFEVKLNYGESLLWNSNFLKAKTYFEGLVEEDSISFPALLGYANTLSNIKEYEGALLYVNKALAILPGNPNALNSKKYMYLGYAYQKQQAQQYDEAEALLKENLALFIDDKDTLLNLANLYLIANRLDDAKATYNLLAENGDNKVTALNGLALVSHLKDKDKEALIISRKAYDIIPVLKKSSDIKQTQERYIQALIWNKKYKQSEELIDALLKEQPNKNWILVLQATLNLYKSNFKSSLKGYNRVLINDSISFDGNLGKANALKALGYYDDAYKSAENTLTFYDNQKDALNFIKNLNTTFTPFYEIKAGYTVDNGDNKAFAINNTVEIPFSTKFKLLGSHNYRTTANNVTNNSATSNGVNGGISYQILPNAIFKGTAGIISVNSKNNKYNQLLANLSLNVRPFKLQTLDLSYKREIQNFNAELLAREIVMNNFFVNYNLSTNFKLGWFTQYYFTSQNDDNVRNLFFTSLYYNIFSKPSLKAGLNYQYITFKNQVPIIYFSPKEFNAGEIFINMIKDEVITKPKEWFYELTAAFGLQYIEDYDSQSTYRFHGKVGYKFSERCLVNIYGTNSNIASATAAGFTFAEIGFRFKWYLFKKPIFRK